MNSPQNSTKNLYNSNDAPLQKINKYGHIFWINFDGDASNIVEKWETDIKQVNMIKFYMRISKI